MRPEIEYSAVESALFEVHHTVEDNVTWQSDDETFGKREHWATVYGKTHGDCDDFAITKLRALCERFPDYQRTFRLATCCEGLDENGIFKGYHMVLLVHTSRGVYVLDNHFKDPIAIVDIPNRVWCYQEPEEADGPWVHFKKPKGRYTIKVLTPDRKVI